MLCFIIESYVFHSTENNYFLLTSVSSKRQQFVTVECDSRHYNTRQCDAKQKVKYNVIIGNSHLGKI